MYCSKCILAPSSDYPIEQAHSRMTRARVGAMDKILFFFSFFFWAHTTNIHDKSYNIIKKDIIKSILVMEVWHS